MSPLLLSIVRILQNQQPGNPLYSHAKSISFAPVVRYVRLTHSSSSLAWACTCSNNIAFWRLSAAWVARFPVFYPACHVWLISYCQIPRSSKSYCDALNLFPLQLPESLFEEVAEIGYGVGNAYFTPVIGSFYLRNNLRGLFGVKAVGIIGKWSRYWIIRVFNLYQLFQLPLFNNCKINFSAFFVTDISQFIFIALAVFEIVQSFQERCGNKVLKTNPLIAQHVTIIKEAQRNCNPTYYERDRGAGSLALLPFLPSVFSVSAPVFLFVFHLSFVVPLVTVLSHFLII